MTQHSNKPLDSNDAGKLFVFALLSILPTIFGVGLVPALFLLFGIFMLRKSGDFGHIETAARNYRIFCVLAFLGVGSIAGFWVVQHLEADSWPADQYLENAALAAIGSLIPLIYIFVMQGLFLEPLRANKERIARKVSVFLGRSSLGSAGGIDIIKGERLRSFSVADELIKWAKLKSDGHITENEFSDARRKLLERN